MAEEQGRYQMLWDCPSCGTGGLLALDHKFCPNCGGAQNPSWRYFPSDDQKVAVEDHVFHGADKICPACESPNSGVSTFCQACGSPLEGAREAARRADRVLGEGEVDSGESVKDAKQEAAARKQAEEQRRIREMAGDRAPKEKKKRSVGGWIGLGCGLFVVLGTVACIGFFLLSWLFQTSGEVQVAGHHWERSIQVEQFGAVEKSDWKNEVPAGARDVTCRDEVKDTQKVQDGETCKTRKKDNGDGTFTEVKECEPKYREEKVYAPKCSYTVDDWKVGRTEQAAGNDTSPRWPEVRLAGSQEREGERKETYTVELRDEDGGKHTCDLPEARWKALSVGQSTEVTFGGLTGKIDCRGLK